ncbi:P-II family nitrogen regulator [Nesterenkonia muleiensis]|uniref:P-II family nitrogen regulator n=1 Tax=Nesterenkonia muleiensis TaxID=2282648 RepID=UPI000E735D3E|nr:P-II family nitrogen regulator [Nesterenkonia muleiensis]
MKLVTAVIQRKKLDAVTEALATKGIGGLTVTDVLGYGTQGGRKEVFRGKEFSVDFLPKTKIEVVVPGEIVEEIIDAIVAAARTGEIGDGKVWATEITGVVRVRTGEHGADAI